MPTALHAVIAAAGFGSRLGRGHPKCLLEVAGRPILAHQMEALASVPEVRVVVGYQEEAVAALARSLRPDVVIVRNPRYATTTTLDSLALATRGIDGPCLVLDGDLLLWSADVEDLLLRQVDQGRPVVCFTPARTADAVYVEVRPDGTGGLPLVLGFDRQNSTAWEWANIALVPAGYFQPGGGDVYARLSHDLPLAAHQVDSWEIDRQEDLDRVLAHLASSSSLATTGAAR